MNELVSLIINLIILVFFWVMIWFGGLEPTTTKIVGVGFILLAVITTTQVIRIIKI